MDSDNWAGGVHVVGGPPVGTLALQGGVVRTQLVVEPVLNGGHCGQATHSCGSFEHFGSNKNDPLGFSCVSGFTFQTKSAVRCTRAGF